MSVNEELMKQMMKTMEAMQAKMEAKPKTEEDEWTIASEPFKEELEDVDRRPDYEDLVSLPKDIADKKELAVFSTGTFLDSLFLDGNRKSISGIPHGAQVGVTGIAGAGKSILMEEIAVIVAASGKKVLYVTSEDTFISESPRFDLQSRMMQKAKELNLDWNIIKNNLMVMDAIAHTELRSWNTFAEVYRYIAERNEIELSLIDSVTMLESYRGALKYRVMELCRFNQVRGITAIYVNQRVSEDFDKYSMAGGIGIAHGLDSTLIVDYGRLYYGDQIKDLASKRGNYERLCRVLDCRLSGFVREHIGLDITDTGMLRASSQGQAILANYK